MRCATSRVMITCWTFPPALDLSPGVSTAQKDEQKGSNRKGMEVGREVERGGAEIKMEKKFPNETTTSKVFHTRKYTHLLTKHNMMQFILYIFKPRSYYHIWKLPGKLGPVLFPLAILCTTCERGKLCPPVQRLSIAAGSLCAVLITPAPSSCFPHAARQLHCSGACLVGDEYKSSKDNKCFDSSSSAIIPILRGSKKAMSAKAVCKRVNVISEKVGRSQNDHCDFVLEHKNAQKWMETLFLSNISERELLLRQVSQANMRPEQVLADRTAYLNFNGGSRNKWGGPEELYGFYSQSKSELNQANLYSKFVKPRSVGGSRLCCHNFQKYFAKRVSIRYEALLSKNKS
ncbi:hypothetical protein EK904_011890 [Melospiza melodia maxima]|nr:hypothetical protein EK904_011890 [Melospiza melodia maxima]